MESTILTTKLYIPPKKEGVVPRPDLVNRLNSGLSSRITLVSAPAGFGKTTLLSKWVEQLEIPVSWVTLDEGDNDLVRFLSYFSSALMAIESTVGDDALALLQSPQQYSVDAVLTYLINDVAEYSSPLVVVFDDYHHIVEDEVQEAVQFVIENIPQHMHMVLSGRADPPWPLARFRSRGWLAELRAPDLRFTIDETKQFLQDVMGIDISEKDLLDLDSRTEGWIAGIQMAALSMKSQSDIPAFIRAFTGSHRYILDYLLEEVLSQQSVAIRDFLLKTSILEMLTGSLCDHITNRQDSALILRQLEESNLFLIPMDDARHWFRYHHLFAELLRSELRRTSSEEEADLHRLAIEWHEERGAIAEAMQHALISDNIPAAIQILERHALGLVFQGALGTVRRWLDSLPREVVEPRPWLCVAYAWLMLNLGQLDEFAGWVEMAETVLESSADITEAEGNHIHGQIASMQSYSAWLAGDLDLCVQRAQDALQLLPKDDHMARAWSASLLGSMLRETGVYSEAATALMESVNLSVEAGNYNLAIDALWELSGVYQMQGRLHKTFETCERALILEEEYVKKTGRRLPATGYTYTRLTSLLFERNELARAREYAQKAVDRISRWGQIDARVWSYLNLARVQQALHENEALESSLNIAQEAVQNLSSLYRVHAESMEARIRLLQGDLEAAQEWADRSGLRSDDEIQIHDSLAYGILASILVSKGMHGEKASLEEASKLLEKLGSLYEAVGAKTQLIQTLIQSSIVLYTDEELDSAIEQIGRAITLAEPEGHIRVFVEGGKPVADLLQMVPSRERRSGYVSSLLEAISSKPDVSEYEELAVGPALIEPLSEREQEVLRLLSTHLSSKEIARELYIAVSTVRTHIKNIYSKLGVHSRLQAVTEAERLGLLRER